MISHDGLRLASSADRAKKSVPIKALVCAAGEPQGCIKLQFLGRGQLVPDTVCLMLRGQAVPAPFSRAFELELDAALAVQKV